MGDSGDGCGGRWGDTLCVYVYMNTLPLQCACHAPSTYPPLLHILHTPHSSPPTYHTPCIQEEEGICTSKYFSENGLVELLEKAAEHFKEAQLYEAVNEVYKLVLPIYEAKRSHQDVERVYRMLSECYKDLVKKGEHRFLGSYFRVGFYGLLFGDLDTQEFIYKEAALTRLGEFSINLQVHEVEGGGERRGMSLLSNVGIVSRYLLHVQTLDLFSLQKLYADKLGTDKVELLKESGDEKLSSLDPAKVSL